MIIVALRVIIAYYSFAVNIKNRRFMGNVGEQKRRNENGCGIHDKRMSKQFENKVKSNCVGTVAPTVRVCETNAKSNSADDRGGRPYNKI